MQLVFFGTSSATPTRRRNVSGLGLKLDDQPQWWLFDCGEGTQHRLLRSTLSLARLGAVFVTHLHGDHIFGLPGLLSSRGLAGSRDKVDLFGPEGLRQFLSGIQQSTPNHFAFPLPFTPLRSGLRIDLSNHVITVAEVVHTKPTFAFHIEEKPSPGRFRVEEAMALGVPPGPIYGRLKNGETITLEDGKVIDGSRLVDSPKPPRRIVIVGDSGDSTNMLDIGQGADLLVHEATFLDATHRKHALEYRHSTAANAGRIARLMGVKTLVLNHFSPRYESPGGEGIEALTEEAKREFGQGDVYAAYDGFSISVDRSRDSKSSNEEP